MDSTICTRYTEDSNYDLGSCLITKKYLLEVYPSLIPEVKSPGLWVWGKNDQGQLGTNDDIDRSSPVQTISSGTNWRSVSTGSAIGFIISAAIKTDGTLWTWGYNYKGQLGNNNIIDRSSPVQTVSGGTNWRSVSVGLSHVVSIKTDGTLWAWGSYIAGRLGTNNAINRSSPVQTVSGGTNWCSVSTFSYHNAAIKTDGTLWTWGCGLSGRLGDNAAIDRSSPVQTVSGGTSWCSVSAGNSTTAAIKTDGTLWTWGLNTQGALGTNNVISRSSPVQTVSGGYNWRSVSVGSIGAAAIKTDGTLWVWGGGSNGVLGTNDNIARSSPVQTVSGGTNWFSVVVGTNNTASIKTDGTIWTWGCNCAGQLGNNNRIDISSPVQTVSGGTNWRSVSIRRSTLAIRDDGEY
jgi:alpha-tubulin suppressor-like RCC1 family protein